MQLLVNFHVTLSCFWPLVQKSYISSHHFAEQLLLWNTSKASSVFWKAEEDFRETFWIIWQILSSSFWETSAGRLIFWRNKETKRWIFVWHNAAKGGERIAKAYCVPEKRCSECIEKILRYKTMVEISWWLKTPVQKQWSLFFNQVVGLSQNTSGGCFCPQHLLQLFSNNFVNVLIRYFRFH